MSYGVKMFVETINQERMSLRDKIFIINETRKPMSRRDKIFIKSIKPENRCPVGTKYL
jgi:hypothetical protein